ncbi:MAG: tetratricopeptide repeat protein [Saprospiraceae bacterium]|nr:tetratricopeptide repeat protein [Saprospiraceae bacterium]
MKHVNSDQQMSVKLLVSSYLELSQKGTAPFIEETVFLQMVDLSNEEGNWRRALRFATEGITQHPFCADLYLRKAQLLLNQNKIAESLVTIEQAEIFAPMNVNIRLLHAELLAVKGQTDAALLLLEDGKSHVSRSELSEIHLVEAQIFGDLGRFKEMFESVKRALLADSSNTEGYEKILWATEYSLKFDQSIVLHNQLLDRDAYNWRAWLNIGFAHEAKGQLDEAITAFEFAFAIDEKCRAAYMEAGELHVQKGNYLRALYVYENAIFNTEEDATLLQRIGLCYQKIGDLKSAKVALNRALELDGNDHETHFRLGECAALDGKYAQAVNFYLRATVLNSKNEAYFAALGDAYYHLENYSKAVASYRKAAFIAPDDVDYWLRYAGFWLKVGQEKKALKVLENAEIYTFGAEIEYCRIACLFSMGRRSEAMYRLTEALQTDFDKYETVLTWQPTLAENADFQAVVKSFQPL